MRKYGIISRILKRGGKEMKLKFYKILLILMLHVTTKHYDKHD